MIVGETRTVRHTETGESAFTFDATPTLEVTTPSGSVGNPAVSVSPGTSSVTQTLSATIEFTEGGEYRLAWDMDQGDDNPIRRIETYFAAWTDVYSLIRTRLQKTVTQLPNATIDPELSYITREVLATFTQVYNDLDSADQAFFDRGLALTVAARLHSSLPAAATGEVKRRKQRDQEIEYTTASSATAEPLPVQWAKEASQAFGRVSFIRTARRSQASAYSSIRVAGPSRAARDAGCRSALIDDVLRLIYPDWCPECTG